MLSAVTYAESASGGIESDVNCGNVGVIQRGQDLRFTLKPRHPFGVTRERFWQDFRRDIAPELGIPGTIYFAHSARTNSSEDFIGADAIARDQRHLGWIIPLGTLTHPIT